MSDQANEPTKLGNRQRTIAFLLAHKKIFIPLTALVALLFIFIIGSYLYVSNYQKYTYKTVSSYGKDHPEVVGVGIVFGSGITKDGKPYKELQGRLDQAASFLSYGAVQQLILSGDNRFPNYNEPQAMIDYLVNVQHVSRNKLVADYAGRSTYETCERATKIFSVSKAVLFSAPSHLPRAVFTCRKFGIEAYGVAAGADANNATRRELLARPKAVFNQYFIGEKTVLGPKINL